MADNVVLRVDHNLRDTRQDMRHLNDEMGRNKQAFDTLNRSAKQSTDTMTDGAKQASAGFANLRSTLAGLATVGAFAALAKGIVDTTSRYEDLRSTLTTVEQSSVKAARAFDMLNKLAAATPFSVESLTESYIKLRNRGLQPTEQDLIALGDLAASQGKELDQVTEAMLDALTGENERLKEFGIQASKAGDQVTFTFKGVQTTVAATPQAIQGAILAFGRMDGVAGGMAARSQTLSGQVSTLKDNLAQLAAGIGNAVLPAIKGMVGLVADGVEWVGKLFGVTKDYNQEALQQSVNLAKGMNTLKTYNSLVADNTLSEEARQRVLRERGQTIKDLNDEFGPYLGAQITEQTNVEELNRLYAVANQRIMEQMTLKIRAKILEDELNKANETATELIKARAGLLNDEASAFNQLGAIIKTNTAQAATQNEFNAAYNNIVGEVIRKQQELDKVTGQLVSTKFGEADATNKTTAALKGNDAALKKLLESQERYLQQTRDLQLSNDVADVRTKAGQEELKLAIARDRAMKEAEQEGISAEAIAERKLAIEQQFIIERNKLRFQELDSLKTIATKDAKTVFDAYDVANVAMMQAQGMMQDDLEAMSRAASERIFQHYADKAAEFADYAGNLGKEVLGFVSALQAGEAARTQQQLDAQVDAINTRISDTEASVARLNEAAAAATGQRQTELLQQAALQAATIDQEKRKLEELDATRKRVALQQAKREKAVALAGAVINTAQGVTKVLATTPTADFGIARAILIATTLASGFAQVASIAAQPLPQFRHGGPVPEGGGLLRGPRHSGGGIPLEAEGGEWIFSREKTRQFRPLFEAIQDGKVNPQQMQAGNSQPRVDSSLAPLADALRNLKQVHVNLDAKGFRVAEQTAQSKTQYLNTRYRA
jgi:hypothetical protein